MLRNIEFSTIILAAGRSSRMFSGIPKILHCIGGKYILRHVIDTAVQIGSKDIYVVYGNGYDKKFLINTLGVQDNTSVSWVLQSSSFGTAHAVKQVLPLLLDNLDILILYADVPLVSCSTLYKLFDTKNKYGGISLLTVFLKKNDGYGKVIRNEDGTVIGIIEDSDIVSEDHKMINEVNTGIMVVTSQDLKRWVSCVSNYSNINREFYLTDIIHIAWSEGCLVNTVLPNEDYEVMGVNTKLQLVELERIYQRNQAIRLLRSGVMISDVNRFDLRGELCCGYDVCIDVNVIIEGKVFLGNRVNIGIGCILRNSFIGDDVIIYPYSFVDGSKISSHSVIGPFARLRVDNEIGENSAIGNFVELKNTRLGKCTKVNHVSYIGDTEVGSMVNVGAGTVVCNYDGVNKYKTVIGDNVFIGADSQIVAPVKIGTGAKIGAGTTVTRDVEADEIVISRVRQFTISSWSRFSKRKEKD